MIDSFPWDSLVVEMGDDGFPVYDRSYSADDLAEVYETFFSFGVFINSDEGMVVKSNNNMTLTVGYGKCHIRGRIGYIVKEREIVNVEAASSQPRIDTVVLRWDKRLSVRNIIVDVVKGTPAASPTRPALTRTSSVYELGLADVLVKANTASILQQNITDTRLETDRCGVVTPFMTIDTTSFYEKMEATLNAGIQRQLQQSEKQMNKLNAEIDRVITISNKLTDGTGTNCGCYQEIQEIKSLLYDFLDSQGDRRYYFVGKTLYVPSGWGSFDDEEVKLNRNAEFDGETIVLS